MEQILISIKPEWVAKILNGEKTIEIRRTKPMKIIYLAKYLYIVVRVKKIIIYANYIKIINTLITLMKAIKAVD